MPLDFVKAHFDEIMKDKPNIFGFDLGACCPASAGDFATRSRAASYRPSSGRSHPTIHGAPRTLAQTARKHRPAASRPGPRSSPASSSFCAGSDPAGPAFTGETGTFAGRGLNVAGVWVNGSNPNAALSAAHSEELLAQPAAHRSHHREHRNLDVPARRDHDDVPRVLPEQAEGRRGAFAWWSATAYRSPWRFPCPTMSRIKQIPGVQEAMVGNWFGGTYKDNRDPKNMFARFAVEPAKLFTVYGEMQLPEDEKQAFLRDRAGCIIGRDVPRNHNLKVGDKIPITGDIYPGNYEFTVRGIFDWPRSSEVLYFDKEYIEQSMPERRRGQVGILYVRIDDPQNSARRSRPPSTASSGIPGGDETETEQAFTIGFLSLLGNVKMFLIAISGPSPSPFCWFPPTPWRCRCGSAFARSASSRPSGSLPGEDPRPDSRRGDFPSPLPAGSSAT